MDWFLKKEMIGLAGAGSASCAGAIHTRLAVTARSRSYPCHDRLTFPGTASGRVQRSPSQEEGFEALCKDGWSFDGGGIGRALWVPAWHGHFTRFTLAKGVAQFQQEFLDTLGVARGEDRGASVQEWGIDARVARVGSARMARNLVRAIDAIRECPGCCSLQGQPVRSDTAESLQWQILRS